MDLHKNDSVRPSSKLSGNRLYFAAAAVVRLSTRTGAVSFTNKETTAPNATPANGIQKIF